MEMSKISVNDTLPVNNILSNVSDSIFSSL